MTTLELRDGLELLGGEARFRHLYCRGGCRRRRRGDVARVLGDRATVLTRDEAIPWLAHRPRARRRPAGRGPQPRAGSRRRGRAAARGRDRPDRTRRARLARRRHARARRVDPNGAFVLRASLPR